MLQHPLATGSSEYQEKNEEETFSELPPLTDDDLSSFVRRVSSPRPQDDSVVRAASPFGKRYLKPINGIQIKGFARSAQRRSSVLTLGSIERLQHFYAKRDLKVNKVGTLGFNTALMEEPDELDQLPTPTAPPPSWLDMNVETDLDVLLSKCFEDIQTTLATWAMVTGPHVSSSSSSSGDSEGSFQILPLLDSVTKMLDSIRNYTFNRQDLSTEAVNKLRMAALALLESMKELEGEHRLADEEGGSEGYIYSSSDFNLLERERQAILTYLDTIEKYGFNPPHHLGGSPATFTPEIKALMGKTSVLSIQDNQEEQVAKGSGVPVWLERGSFVNDPMARYHAMLMDNRDDTLTDPIPDPKEDEDAFLQSLCDGIILCTAYNNVVKRTRRPFGFINKIHQDSRRTYRAIENLRFFTAACKFRFELLFTEFDPSEIARKTDKGLTQMKKILELFCDCVIKELREHVDSLQRKQ